MVEVESSLRDRVFVVAGTLVCFAALVGVIGLAPWSATDWRTATLVLGVVAFASYGLHRYEQVTLGLVREDEP